LCLRRSLEARILDMEGVVHAACRLVDDYRSDSPDGGASTGALCKAVDRMRGEER
jgi:hypothetical protein